MAAPLGSRLSRAVLVGVMGFGLSTLLLWSWGPPLLKADQQDGDAADDSAMIDPLGPNAACYVCHTTFVHEELSKVHLPEKVTCIRCHGLSAAHANDENIGATPPDVTFARDKIDASCSLADCHDKHDVPAKAVIARWLERERPDSPAVCTDCHGMHKIERPEGGYPGLTSAGPPST